MRFRLIAFIFTISLLISPSYNLRGPASYEQNSKIGVLGDLEGHLFRFNDFLDNSGTFVRNSDGEVELKDGHQFVFLGDASDREAGSIRIMETLISLKEKYPDRVTIILGNRDINKMRILALMQANENKPIPQIVVPWYKKILEEEYGVVFKSRPSLEEFRLIASRYDTPTLRFKAFLKGMNAPEAFEFRKKELEILNATSNISDDFVYEDFMKDFSRGGLYDRYLSLGELGKVIDGNVFVHGAITSENIGYIPGVRKRNLNIHRWIEQLNNWAHKEIRDWVSDSSLGKDLIKYHAPKPGSIKNDASVVYSRFSNSSGNAKAPRRFVMNKLKENGIHRIVVGHTPAGDYPFIVRKGDFEVVLADSSFSNIETSSKIEIRGKDLSIRSTDYNGKKIVVESNVDEVTNPIGMRTNDGHRIVGLIENSNQFMMMKVDGQGRHFETEYKVIDDKELIIKNLIENQKNDRPCFKIVDDFFSSLLVKKLKI